MSSNRKPKTLPSQLEMDIQSPSSRPCPPTNTVRRNPARKARPPASAIKLGEPLAAPDPPPPENLKVFLRIRPFAVQTTGNAKRISDSKNVWPKIPKSKTTTRPKAVKSNEVCVQVNEDLKSVTVSTPQSVLESKRAKSEVAYEGFSRVFSSEASQADVYEQMVRPMVDEFLKGKSGMLTAMGPSGSGKTHTVFGSVREPGMVPLALRGILDKDTAAKFSRKFFLSVMEINSEQGKNEKLIDLLHDGGDVYMQQSVVKGIQEAVVSDAHHAESLIARGMLKRATATTNSNCQSSRSQCVINIRSASKSPDGEDDDSLLTIIDLAGAEKEKKTGNQGSRLLESNFINNTSMVFGLCLRSLLDHQKNRKKPLPKHYHNSLLTRYMRDYLEGKKRMTLILTVKPGMEDYPETSFLLKQASPFAEIKFKNDCSKRPIQAFPRAEQLKRMKFSNNEASLIDEGDNYSGLSAKNCKVIKSTEIPKEALNDCLDQKIKDDENIILTEIPVLFDKSTIFETKKDHALSKVDKDRDYQILLGLSKAFWTLLKESKKEVEVLKTENQELKDTVNKEKLRLLGLESELKELNVQCTCREAVNNTLPVTRHDSTSSILNHQTVEPVEVKSEVLSCQLKELDEITNEKKTDILATSANPAVSYSGSSRDDSNHHQVTDVSPDVSFSGREDESSEKVLNVTTDEELNENEILSNESSFPTCIECESVSGSPDDEDPVDATGKLSEHQSTETGKRGSVAALLDNDLTSSASQKNGDFIHVEEEQTIPVPNHATSNISNHQAVEPVEVIDATPDVSFSGKDDGNHLKYQPQFGSVAALPDNDFCSSAPQKDGDSINVEEEQPFRKGDEVDVLPNEGQDVKVESNVVPKLSSGGKLQPAAKPKRRLLPSSSVLLKDMSILDVTDENDRPKVAKGRKTVAADDKNRTQGSLSLLRLLRTELHH